jgi:hypothetical protein
MNEVSEIRSQSVFKALQAEGALSTTMARYYNPNIGRFISEDPLGFGRAISFGEDQDPDIEISSYLEEFGAVGADQEMGIVASEESLTIIGELPPYSYAFNSPVVYVDPTGEWAGAIRGIITVGRHLIRRYGPIIVAGGKQAWKFCKNIRCKKPEIHGPHHKFFWGKRHCHIQMTCWIKGKKGSGMNVRIPIPCGKITGPSRKP